MINMMLGKCEQPPSISFKIDEVTATRGKSIGLSAIFSITVVPLAEGNWIQKTFYKMTTANQ